MNLYLKIFIFLIFITGGFYYVYNYIELPSKEKNTFTEINIYALDEDRNYLKTGYSIYEGSSLIKEGTTNSKGFVLEEIQINSSFSIFNTNLDNQNYYSNPIEIVSYEDLNPRIELKLIKIGNVSLKDSGSLEDSTSFNAFFGINDNLKNTVICLDWGIHIIKADIEEVELINEIEDYNKCYSYGDLSNQQLNIKIDYKTFGTLGSSDYLELIFYHKDLNGDIEKKDYEEINRFLFK